MTRSRISHAPAYHAAPPPASPYAVNRPSFTMRTVGVLCALVAAVAAQADSVTKKSGEVVRGRVEAVSDSGVVVVGATSRASIAWAEITDVRSEAAVAVPLANGDKVTGVLRGVSGGKLRVETAAFGELAVATSALAAPPPPPKEEKPAEEAKSPLTPSPWKGKVGLSGSLRSGNIDSSLFALRAEAERSWEEDKLSAALEALYGRTNNDTTAESLFGKVRYDHFWSKTFYGYASMEALHDEIQNLSIRVVGSVGVGDVLWKAADDRLLAIEGGLSGIYEDFTTAGDSELQPAARVAATYKEVLFKSVRFEQSIELLTPVTDLGDYIAHSRTSFAVPVSEGWAMRTSLDLIYQGDPPANTDNLDILFLVGLEYAF